MPPRGELAFVSCFVLRDGCFRNLVERSAGVTHPDVAGAVMVGQGIARDLVEPRGEAIGPFQRPARTVNAQEDLLKEIVCVRGVADATGDERPQSAAELGPDRLD